MTESQIEPVLKALRDADPAWADIDAYQSGDVLLELDDGSLAYGTRRDNGSWVQFVGGVALRLCGPPADDEDDVIGHLTAPREPLRFCFVPDAVAIHFMAH